MATIDPNIALGVKPIQIENPMNQYAMLSQIQGNQQAQQLNTLKMRQAQQEFDTSNALANAYKGAITPEGNVNYNALIPSLASSGAGSAIPGVLKTKKETEQAAAMLEKTQIEAKQKKLEVQREQFANLSFNPSDENVKAHLQDSILKGELPQQQADQLWAKVSKLNPAQRSQYFTEMGMKAHELGTYKETNRANLQKEATAKDTLIENTRSHKVNEGISGANLAVNQQNANLNREKFAFETNPEKVGIIAEAKKTAELNATDKLAKAKTIEGATQILKDIKYDPKTKDNDVSKLIDISTGSYGGAAINLGNRVFGRSTEGSKAIAELKTIESKITTDLLGGKLGSGISNADRDFIQQQVGLIGDATLPTGDRKAAWSRVVNRLADISSKNSATTVIAPPSGFVAD